MQHAILKFFTFFMLIPGFLFSQSHNRDFVRDLHTGDSLFKAKKYTQAFNIYDTLFTKHQIYTPRSFLKMAYIKEGLGQYAKTLYYLDYYYQVNPDKAVLKKMEKLAEKHNLEGYEYNDSNYFSMLYHKYDYWIYVFLTIICGLFFLNYIYHAVHKNKRALKAATSVIIAVIITFTYTNHANALLLSRKGIVIQDNTLIMKGPSAGSTLLKRVDKGHRLKILGNQDIWYKIVWKGETGYVRKDNLLPLQKPGI